MHFAVTTAGGAMVKGFVVFGIVAFFGLKILWRGITDDITDSFGHRNGSQWWWIVGGLLLLVPLVAFTIFAIRQGFFRG